LVLVLVLVLDLDLDLFQVWFSVTVGFGYVVLRLVWVLLCCSLVTRIICGAAQLTDSLDIDGNTCLHKACANGQADVARFLVERFPNLKEIANNKGVLPAVS
jgi:hypothetical protein